jgi:hypothetical protein
VVQRFVEREVIVLPAYRPGETGAGGGERLEAELDKQAGAANIPGIREYEASRAVKVPEGSKPLVGRHVK